MRAERRLSLRLAAVAAGVTIAVCVALSPAAAIAAAAPGQQAGGVAAPLPQSGTPGSPEAPGASEAPGATRTQTESPLSSPPAEVEVQLSNERTITSWAHPESPGPIYTHPDTRAARVAKVHLYDADGFPEVYMLLSSRVDAAGLEWVRVRIPGRPNGRIGWMARELLGSLHRTRWRIVVDRGAHRMRVYYGGRLRRAFPVGVGKPSTPTPTGHFWIDERFKLSSPSNPYWPYALGTSDYSTLPNWAGEGVVGIHGPFGEPQKIPGDPSHGCIRMLAPDIAWLGPRVTLGTPVDVIP